MVTRPVIPEPVGPVPVGAGLAGEVPSCAGPDGAGPDGDGTGAPGPTGDPVTEGDGPGARVVPPPAVQPAATASRSPVTMIERQVRITGWTRRTRSRFPPGARQGHAGQESGSRQGFGPLRLGPNCPNIARHPPISMKGGTFLCLRVPGRSGLRRWLVEHRLRGLVQWRRYVDQRVPARYHGQRRRPVLGGERRVGRV